MFGPILDGERVRLAPITVDMLPTFSRWFADTEVTRFLSLRYPPAAKLEEEWFERTMRSETDVVWATLLREENDRLIGTTGIHAIDWPNRRASTGNVIGEKTEWRKGYATEVIRLRTRWAFEEMGLEKLATKVFVENVGSRRALEKSGYREVGLARRDEWRHGKWHDMWLAEVLRDEWAAAG